MGLTSTVSRNQYNGADSVGPFTYSFRIVDEADLRVTKRSAAGLETRLTLNTHYTVTGVKNASGTITLTTALATGEVLTIRRERSVKQATSIRNQARYSGSLHEDALDAIIMSAQSMKDQLDRSFRVRETYDPATFSLDLKPETGKVVGWVSPTELGNLTLDSSAVALPGNGRTVSTLSAYLLNNQVFNVLDYGAVGDLVTDDYTAIAATFAAAHNGGLVVFPNTSAGGYLSSQTLVPGTTMTIFFQDVTIKATKGSAKSGTITSVSGSPNIVGSAGALFLTEYAVGAFIEANGESRRITVITDNTHLTTSSNWTSSAAGLSHYRPRFTQVFDYTGVQATADTLLPGTCTKYVFFDILGFKLSSSLGRVKFDGNDVTNLVGLGISNPSSTTGGDSANVTWLVDASFQNFEIGIYGQSDGVAFTGWFLAYVHTQSNGYNVWGKGNSMDDMAFGVLRSQAQTATADDNKIHVYLENVSGVTIMSLFLKEQATVKVASGNATGGTATTLVKAGAGRSVNGDIGYIVRINSGTGAGNARAVVSNDATSWTIAAAWDAAISPDATSVFEILQLRRDGLVLHNGSVTVLHLYVEGEWLDAVRMDSNNYKFVCPNFAMGKTVCTTDQNIGIKVSAAQGVLDVSFNSENVNRTPTLRYLVGLQATAASQIRTSRVRMPMAINGGAANLLQPYFYYSGTNPSKNDSAIAETADGISRWGFNGLSTYYFIEGTTVSKTLTSALNNDLDIGGATIIHITPNADKTTNLSGLKGGVAGRRVRLILDTADPFKLKTTGADSVAQNRILGFHTDPIMFRQQYDAAELEYDVDAASGVGRWRVISMPRSVARPYLTADVALSATATIDLTELDLMIGAQETIQVDYFLTVITSAGVVGLKPHFSLPAGVTGYMMIEGNTGASTTNDFFRSATPGTASTTAFVTAAVMTGFIHIRVVLVAGTNPGTVRLQLDTGAAAAGNVKAGSAAMMVA